MSRHAPRRMLEQRRSLSVMARPTQSRIACSSWSFLWLKKKTANLDLLRKDDTNICRVSIVSGEHERKDEHTMVEKKVLVRQQLFRKRGEWITAIPKNLVQRSTLSISGHVFMVFLHPSTCEEFPRGCLEKDDEMMMARHRKAQASFETSPTHSKLGSSSTQTAVAYSTSSFTDRYSLDSG